MTNVVAMISKAVMTRLARWPRVGILVGYIGQRQQAGESLRADNRGIA